MKALRAVLAEILHLFADDGSLALALIAWTAVLGLAVRLAPELPPAAYGGALVVGYVVVLLGDVAPAGRRR